MKAPLKDATKRDCIVIQSVLKIKEKQFITFNNFKQKYLNYISKILYKICVIKIKYFKKMLRKQ